MAERPECSDRRVGDLMAAYELGMLDDAERKQVEEHLTGCPACQESLYTMAPVALELRSEPARYRRAVEEGLQRSRAAERPSLWQRLGEALSPRILVPVTMAAAAAVALVFLLPDAGKSPADLAFIEPVPYVLMQTRDAETGADSLFTAGMTAYVASEFDAAAGDLGRSLRVADPNWRSVHQARFFQGLSLLLAGRAQSALTPLTEASIGSPRPLAERARWYSAQAHLRLGDGATASEILATLIDSPAYGTVARDQLEALQELGADTDN